MKTLMISLVLGVLIGVGAGFGVGSFKASLSPWDPSLENNQGEIIAKAKAEGEKKTEKAEDEPATVVAQKRPKVKVDEYAYDFGIVEKTPANEKGEHKFYIENVGDDVMTLVEGGKGCFCTEYSISPKSIKPGEKATILFEWDGARSGGVFSQGVKILTNDPEHSEVVFAVRGLYTSPIISDPGEIFFPSASATTGASRPFRILNFEKNADGSPYDLKIEGIELSDNDYFAVELNKGTREDLTEDDLKDNLRMQTTNLFLGTLEMKPGMPQGAFQELLRVRTNSEKMPVLEIPIRGQIQSNAIKVVGPLYDDKVDGILKLDSVAQKIGATTSLRLTVFEPIPCNNETVVVKSVRPDWLKVDLKFQDEELQKKSPIRMIEATVQVPANSPLGAFVGPEAERLGQIVFEIGVGTANVRKVVVPVRFTVTPN